jgi:hypothetical protein
MACLQLLVLGQTKKLFKQNRFGLTKDELTYFLRPIRDNNYSYISNLENRFASRLDKVNELFEQTKAFMNLLLLAKHQLNGAELVNLEQTLYTQTIWEDINDLTLRLKGKDEEAQKAALSEAKSLETLTKLLEIMENQVQIGEGGAELGKGVVRAGSSPGAHKTFGSITIVYIDPKNHNNFYVEYEGLKPNLFLVHEGYITNKLYASRIMEIYKNTVGIVYLTQAMFLMMGFAWVFVEYGFAALIREVVIYYASTKVEHLASKVDPTAGKILGLLFLVLSPRPKAAPKLVEAGTEQSVPVTTIEQSVPVITIESSNRSFGDIIASQKAEGKLIADLNRGTVSGAVSKARDALRDKFMELEFGKVAEALDVVAAKAAATPEGVTLRGATMVERTGASGTGGSVSRAESRLRNLDEYKLLEEYYAILEKDQSLLARKEVNAAIQGLKNGKLTYSEAQQEIINILNAAKEATGEYVGDAFAYSTFEVQQAISIPRRANNVPMLDRVYKVKEYGTGKIDYLLAEIKGGRNTRLGFVTKKSYSYKNQKLTITVVEGQWVKQASGEWYYQKIIEIYESGHKDLARKLFEAAKLGNVRTVIVKSGKDLEPFVTFNTDEVVKWFAGKKLPYD